MKDIAISLIAFAGTVVGSGLGVLASQRLTQFRLQKLEEKVDKHNNLVERTYKLEGRVTELEHDVRDIKGV